MVNDIEINIGGNNVFPDAFGDIRVNLGGVKLAGLMEFFQGRAIGVDAPDLNVGILRFQVASGTGYRAPCSDPGYEVGDFPVGLAPYFGAGSFEMGLPVRQVVVLVAPVAVGGFLAQLLCHGVIGAGIIGGDISRTNDHLGPYGPEDIHFFLRLLVGGGEDTAVALHGCCQGEAHPCIAGSTLDDGPSRCQLARCFGVFYHF